MVGNSIPGHRTNDVAAVWTGVDRSTPVHTWQEWGGQVHPIFARCVHVQICCVCFSASDIEIDKFCVWHKCTVCDTLDCEISSGCTMLSSFGSKIGS